MKIVILVDYSSPEFNKDFKLSNMLISQGHNVFLAINENQFNDLKKNCDKAVLGYSFNGKLNNIIRLSELKIDN
ncbi:MAG: hypothetical protein ACI4PF_00190 [Christensenellales bacterium]